MANSNIADCYREFEENYRSESTKTGTAACRTDVTIYHRDTLYRKLPIGILVKVFDQDGGVYYSVIDERGYSHHMGVKCGDISWQLMKGAKESCESPAAYQDSKEDKRRLAEKDEQAILNACDGYVLIKANEVRTANPRLQLSAPLKVFVSVNEPKVEAVYLPPPILLNLRFRQNTKVGLTKLQIDQLQRDGGAATLFIHGYNVTLGRVGRFAQAEDFGERPLPSNLPQAGTIQRPYLHYGDNEISKLVSHALSEQIRIHKDDDNISGGLKSIYKKMDSKFNGDKALSWFPHVEYYLNLAASGKLDSEEPFIDWEKYSRVIGVTWSGSVTPSRVFFRAEMYANEAGRELARVLITLFEANIKVNIITHSLGARVALSALNILGDFDGMYDEKIDNLIMWEAAVADNAITDSYTRDKNPVAMELFPFAHKAVKRIRVVYSGEDGVLDGDNLGGDAEYTGLVGGAYPKKYTSLAGTTSALKEYYYKQNKIDEYYTAFEKLRQEYLLYQGSLNQDNIANSERAREIRRNIEKLLLAEANEVSSDLSKSLNYLKPWSHFRRFRAEDEYFKHIVDVLIYQVFNNWTISAIDMAVRPALGHQGERLTVEGRWFNNEFLSEARKKEWIDPFITKLKDNKFFFFGQIANGRSYFISHSAMRNYEFKALDKKGFFPDIYKQSYKIQIMDRWIKENSKFGRY